MENKSAFVGSQTTSIFWVFTVLPVGRGRVWNAEQCRPQFSVLKIVQSSWENNTNILKTELVYAKQQFFSAISFMELMESTIGIQRTML